MNGDDAREKLDRKGSTQDGEEGALVRRLIRAGLANLLCACWHFYLGVSLLAESPSPASTIGKIILVFGGTQLVIGILMFSKPRAGLLLADIGVFAFCGFMNLLAAEMGAAGWVRFLAYFQFFLAVDTWFQFRLFRRTKEEPGAVPVVVPDKAQHITRVPEHAQPEQIPALHGAHVGTGSQDSFALTEAEVKQIVADPRSFDNVVTGQTVSVAGSIPVPWCLVLGKGVAIAMDQNGEHVWRVFPRSVTALPKSLTIKTDGGQKVSLETDRDTVYPVSAWKCASPSGLKDIQMPLRPPMTEWDVLCWSLTYSKDPESWLRWQPSYGTRAEGLTKLCENRDLLDQQIRLWGVKKAAKWLPEADAPTRAILAPRIADIGISRSRNLLVATSVMWGLSGALLLSNVVIATRTRGELIGSYPFMWSLTLCIALGLGGLVTFIVRYQTKSAIAAMDA